MFGFPELSRVSALVPRRASTRTALAVAAASVTFFAVASAAHAEDCIGSYRMVKGEIPVICQDTFGSRAFFSAGQSAPREPFYTGSINRIEQPADATRPSASPTAAPAPASASSNAAAACDHGMRFVETPNNGATLMIKCS
jgi:hypothetical protein